MDSRAGRPTIFKVYKALYRIREKFEVTLLVQRLSISHYRKELFKKKKKVIIEKKIKTMIC